MRVSNLIYVIGSKYIIYIKLFESFNFQFEYQIHIY